MVLITEMSRSRIFAALLLCAALSPAIAGAQSTLPDVFSGAPQTDILAAIRSIAFTNSSQPAATRESDPYPSTYWKGDLCGNAGCSVWRSDSGVTWQSHNCGNSGCWAWSSYSGNRWDCKFGSFSNAGCRDWVSDIGVSWSCDINSTSEAGCREWKSNTGVVWTCEINHMSNAGCNSWISNSGIQWRGGFNACSNAGCTAWNASAPDNTFLPFFVQINYDFLN